MYQNPETCAVFLPRFTSLLKKQVQFFRQNQLGFTDMSVIDIFTWENLAAISENLALQMRLA